MHAPLHNALKSTLEWRSLTRARAKSASRRSVLSSCWRGNFVGPDQVAKSVGKFNFVVRTERVDPQRFFQADDQYRQAEGIEADQQQRRCILERTERFFVLYGDSPDFIDDDRA